ncbi:26S protease regulatory subunit 7 homolog A [Striga hermonthica]|uniref:26S protease regulatory subunit 7 homolog A n=1 Tax=Striga hermonthica TaxID=68872 RepID=A0A9N7MUP4_STRHE|nr:26S protease regulatory subunit 7 homolog A [Striga hermonthica]
MVRELFQMARSKKACIVFFDEVDAIGGARFDDGVGGDNEVQRTMLEIVNQLDGFDARGNIKVLMATNRPDTLDPALLRPGRLDRKVEFGLPDLESRTQIFKIHTRTMNCERDIRFELLARLCPNSTGADIRSVCTEAGMYAIRARRKTVTEKDFLDAVNKVIKDIQNRSCPIFILSGGTHRHYGGYGTMRRVLRMLGSRPRLKAVPVVKLKRRRTVAEVAVVVSRRRCQNHLA